MRIVARTNGVGVDRDVRILTEALSVWTAPPAFSHYREIGPLRALVDGSNCEDCVIFLERVRARWLRRARRFLLIPNQERYAKRDIGLLARVDHVLVKSQHAREVFSKHHPSVQYIGFTSIDRRLEGATPDYTRFFHLAGGSSLKGTAALIDVWARHPEWPVLTILYHRPDHIGRLPANIALIRRYLPDEELRAMQNAFGIHLCPSLGEGWGHAIVEGMSCGAAVVTTDAPPMNEIVGPDRGVLVPYRHSEPRKLGFSYYVDLDALEAAIERLSAMPVEAKAALGRRARAWFETNDHGFRAVRSRVLADILTTTAAMP